MMMMMMMIINSGAPWVRECGKLPIRENFVITWPYTDRPSAPQVYQRKISGSLWWGFFSAKTNGNPRFVKHTQLGSSGKSTELQNKKQFIIAMKSGAPLLGLAKSLYYLISDWKILSSKWCHGAPVNLGADFGMAGRQCIFFLLFAQTNKTKN